MFVLFHVEPSQSTHKSRSHVFKSDVLVKARENRVQRPSLNRSIWWWWGGGAGGLGGGGG